MIPYRFKLGHEKLAIWFLFGSAELSFLLSQVLGSPSFALRNNLLSMNSTNFISGFLTGAAIAAWIGFLASSGRLIKPFLKG